MKRAKSCGGSGGTFLLHQVGCTTERPLLGVFFVGMRPAPIMTSVPESYGVFLVIRLTLASSILL